MSNGAKANNIHDDFGLVYVIGETGPEAGAAVKIGLNMDEERLRLRLAKLNQGRPGKLVVLHLLRVAHPRWVEHQLHAILEPWQSKHSRGREWFGLRPLGDPNWQRFIDRALAGEMRYASPRPGPMATRCYTSPAGFPEPCSHGARVAG